MTHTLVTIGPSHFCEKARWGLDLKGVPYTEDAHVPMFHWRRIRKHTRRTVPLLEAGDRVLTQSTEILAWADEVGASGPRLFPSDPIARAEVERQVKLWDDKVGVHARRAVYDVILPSAACTRAVFEGSPAWEQTALRLGMPVWRALLVKGLGVTPDKCARSRERLTELFAEASALLQANGPYLAGPAFTASDLTFAALSAIVLMPPEYGWALPDLDALAAAGTLPGADRAVAFRDSLRATPAGQHALRVYREHRR
jgi:glutathione S-transferase